MILHAEPFKEGRKAYVKLPASEFCSLLAELEDLRDVKAVRNAKKRIAAGEETLPAGLVFALAEASHPGQRIALWRQYRGLKRDALAVAAGVQGPYISMIENGRRKGNIDLYRRLATALGCDIGDLA